jgi:hypothetical protein
MHQLESILQTTIQESNEYLQEEMDTIISTIPHLSTKVQKQQQRLTHSIKDNTELCRITSDSIAMLQNNQSITNSRLDNIQTLINTLIHKTTPSSSGLFRNKSRPEFQAHDLFPNQSNSDEDKNLATTQLDMIEIVDTSTTTNILDTTNDSMDMMFNSTTTQNNIHTQQPILNEIDEIKGRNLGNPNPANPT